jgi:hypothetical protein
MSDLYFMPLLCLFFYLLYPRGEIFGFEPSIVTLLLSIAIALVYVKGLPRRLTLAGLVVIAMMFPQITEVSLVLAFSSILTMLLIEHVSRQGLRSLMIAVGFTSSLILMLGWIFSLFLYDSAIHPPGVSFFGSKVGFVNILVFGLMALVYLLLTGKKDYRWTMIYCLCHIFLFTLFSTLSKQIYIAILAYCLVAVPALVYYKKYLITLHLFCSIVAVFFLFTLFGATNLQSRFDAVDLIGSYDHEFTRKVLDNIETIGDVDIVDVNPYVSGVSECHKAENYAGCMQFSSLCRQDYLRPYLDQAIHTEDLVDNFYPAHSSLADYLGNDQAKVKWLVVCSRYVVILDKSDRLTLLVNGLKNLSISKAFGSVEATSLNYLDYYSEELANYPHYHNLMLDLASEAGLVLLAIMMLAILFALYLAIKGDIERNLLGAMVLSFVSLRLLSGSHYELFYLMLIVALIFYKQYTTEC